MKSRVLVVVAVALLAAVVLLRDIGGGAPPPPTRPRARPARAVRSGSAPPALSTRNVFEFGQPTAEPTSRPVAPAPPSLPPVALAPVAAPAVRLVGLVRRAGAIKAALQVHGETMVVGVGEAAGDYTVVAIDDDGVRLRGPDGTTVTLPAGGS